MSRLKSLAQPMMFSRESLVPFENMRSCISQNLPWLLAARDARAASNA